LKNGNFGIADLTVSVAADTFPHRRLLQKDTVLGFAARQTIA
jgi:hypothetical protein